MADCSRHARGPSSDLTNEPKCDEGPSRVPCHQLCATIGACLTARRGPSGPELVEAEYEQPASLRKKP